MPICIRPKRALIVDDEPAIARLLARVVVDSGWTVDAVTSAAEALETFEVGRYGLVITDIDLGDLDGIALALRFLALEPGLLVRLMSGAASDHAERAQTAGLGPILRKPFDLEQVRAIADHI